MHTISFYPVGNGDCSQIVLDNSKRILLDYRQHPNGTDPSKPEINLSQTLKSELKSANRDNFDVVAFTHADNDHIEGCTEFFELLHAGQYQGDDRIKIDELWVPAAILLEKAENEKQSEEFVILRQEARHRLKEGSGIKIFSKPEALVDWMVSVDIDPDTRNHLFIDAGTLVDTFQIESDGVEFFCHSPYMKHCDDNDDIKEIRNDAALIFNIRFLYSGLVYDMLAVGDSTCEVLADIVNITEYHDRTDRLEWNLFNIPHHCSYLALAPSGEKGEKVTPPIDEVQRLLRSGREGAYLVSSSQPIKDNNEAYEQVQPPHIQAKNTYVQYLEEIGGRKFLVTMEEPTTINPRLIKFEISAGGLSKAVAIGSGASMAASTTPSRAG